jgi:hypothetical protein
MSEDDNQKSGGTKDMIDAVTGLVGAVPVYQDLLQPAAQQVGKALGTVAKTVNVALTPLSLVIWGYEKIGAFIEEKVTERLENTPSDDIVTPKPNVAGPAIEALRFTGHEPALSDMYANLLASAMDRNTADHAHPAFVEIIKQLTPEEAKILTLFKNTSAFPLITLRADLEAGQGGTDWVPNFSHLWKLCDSDRPDLYPPYIDNLCRLGLLEIPSGVFLTANNTYEPLESDPLIAHEMDEIKVQPLANKPSIIRKMVRRTPLGKLFIDACVVSKVEPRLTQQGD